MRARRTVLLAAAAAAAALAGCGGGAGPGPAPRKTERALRVEGRKVFVDARCGECHALAAAGAHGGNGPDLDTSERLDRAQIRAALAAGANGMPDYGRLLSPRQFAALVEFLYASTHPR